MIDDVSSREDGSTFDLARCNIVLAYPDDVVLFALSVSHKETLCTKLCSTITQHKLTLNGVKTKCMIFSNTRN